MLTSLQFHRKHFVVSFVKGKTPLKSLPSCTDILSKYLQWTVLKDYNEVKRNAEDREAWRVEGHNTSTFYIRRCTMMMMKNFSERQSLYRQNQG